MTDPSPPTSPAPGPPEPPLASYRAALVRYEAAGLGEILRAIGAPERPSKPDRLPGAITDFLAEPRTAAGLVAGLETGPRLALGLFALAETTSWPAAGLARSLRALGIAPTAALPDLLRLGLLAVRLGPDRPGVVDPARLLDDADGADAELIAHPTARAAARTVLPGPPGPDGAGAVRQVRENDGLEPILRLAALWQRVDESPLRQTQQGVLYKRDRDRLEEDPALSGPITDALAPLPEAPALWLALARGIGLLIDEPGTDRVVAAPAGYWAEHAVHLPQMIAACWLGLREDDAAEGRREEARPVAAAPACLRPAVLLWLATRPEPDWVALDALRAHLDAVDPGWDRPDPAGAGPETKDRRPAPVGTGLLEALLLGPAYQLGLVRAAEEDPGGRRVVQLTPLGRYVLALGSPPPPRPPFDQFLFVQPNFEIIAYRQGLTPALIGQLSRFARWSQVGGALELKLTPESVYRGLEGGLTPEQMLDRLGRHSARPLPAGVAEAIRSWSERRQRVTYYAAATLVEFLSAEDLEGALVEWPAADRPAPVRVSERLLLVEDERSIPFQRFRLAGARDYRRPPEACVAVEPDGVTLSLDVGRSDLFIDAEIARLADELPRRDWADGARRRFRVSAASLARAADDGLATAALTRWFRQRTGGEVPPAILLLLHATGSHPEPLRAARPLIMTTPTTEVLDGLLQHPETRGLLGTRLGPTTVIVPDEAIEGLRRALTSLGLAATGDLSPRDRG
jgi:hypothetical protein